MKNRGSLSPPRLVGRIGRIVWKISEVFRFRPVRGLRTPTLLPQLIGDPIVGNLKGPRPGTPELGIEPTRVTPDGQKDVLDHLFGFRSIQRLGGQIEEQRGKPRVERAKRILPPGRQLHDQLLI